MLNLLHCKQNTPAHHPQQIHNCLAPSLQHLLAHQFLPSLLTDDLGDLGGKLARAVDVANHTIRRIQKAECAKSVVILCAVRGCAMDKSGSRVGSDMRGRYDFESSSTA